MFQQQKHPKATGQNEIKSTITFSFSHRKAFAGKGKHPDF